MARWIRFLFAIAVGAALGMFYGWRVSPARDAQTTPNTLRIDYRSDYVLMVAEIYNQDKDLPAAASRLEVLGDKPLESATRALVFAENQGYDREDLELLRSLNAALLAAGSNLPAEKGSGSSLNSASLGASP